MDENKPKDGGGRAKVKAVRKAAPIEGENDMEPWEQQPGETFDAFQAFSMYRDMGPSRACSKVAKLLGKSTALCTNWSSEWSWVQRAYAHDVDLDRKSRQVEIEERREMARRQAKLGQQVQVLVQIELSKKLRRAAKRQADAEKMGTEAEEVLDATELKQLLEIGAKLERLARGETTDNVQSNVTGEVVTATADAKTFADMMRDKDYRKALDTAARVAERLSGKDSDE